MTNNKNNIHQFEEQQFIQEEKQIEQTQEILNKFSQPVPNGFVKLEQLNWMCSTQNWKEPLCERYSCLVNGKWSQVDIHHTLLEKLGLEKNIPYLVHISTTVVDNGLDHYLAYNIKKKEEIFLKKPFTVESLEEDINKLLDKIKELEGEGRESQKTIADLKNQLAEKEQDKNDWKNEWLKEWRKNKTLTDERNDYQNEYDRIEEELKENQETIQRYLKNVNDLEEEKEHLENEKEEQREKLTQKDGEINNFKKRIVNLKEELQKWTTQFQTPKKAQEEIDALLKEMESRPTQEELNKLQQKLKITEILVEKEFGEESWNELKTRILAELNKV